MIHRRTALCLGCAQLISWGVSYYLIGGFGEAIATDLQWSRDLVYGGFALGLLVMGFSSASTGYLIDRYGGRMVMVAGSCLNAGGCVGLAYCHGVTTYLLAWSCLGLGMRLTLYDAAFAALARIGGPFARVPMSQITLLGGLSSTVFWPLGHFLLDNFGWRYALIAYGGISLLTVPLHLAIPTSLHDDFCRADDDVAHKPLVTSKRELMVAAFLYATIATLANFLNAGMSAHMIQILGGLGLAASISVWIATLRGVGQSAARLCEIVFGRRVDPISLNLFACLLMPLSFVVGLHSGSSAVAAIAFASLYGACNGVLTITRGTLPLMLFHHETYGLLVGKLIAPSFVLSAVAPLAYASVISRYGERWALHVSTVCAVVMLGAALLLFLRFGSSRARGWRKAH